MRGEHHAWAAAPCLVKGSSPHARGARETRGPLRPVGGIIPACAGSTRHARAGEPGRRDHPRMRGEHPIVSIAPTPSSGSSPHARGALLGVDGLGAARGIIPACAGSTVHLSCKLFD